MHKCPPELPKAGVPDCLSPSLAAVLPGNGEKATNIWAHSPLPLAPEGRWKVNKSKAWCKKEERNNKGIS